MKSKTSKKSTKKDGSSESNTAKVSHEKPVSLKPLEFEEAVKGLFGVKPDREKNRNGS